jgi:hypothetical protein
VADSLDEAKATFRAAVGRRALDGAPGREPAVASVCFLRKKQTRNARFEHFC